MQIEELWFDGKKNVELRSIEQPAVLKDNLLIEAEFSGISAGSELLIFRGELPDSMELDLTIKSLKDKSAYPMRYGYAFVGKVIDVGAKVSGDWVGKRAFVFQPHGSHAIVSEAEVMPIPDSITAKQAVFMPNMETAVCLVHDALPMLGDRIVVLGGGVVGLLTTLLLEQFPLKSLYLVEPNPHRRELLRGFCSADILSPDELDASEGEQWADAVIEVSGNPSALNSAIRLTRFNGRIVIGSWYGKKPSNIALGEHFHRSRIQMISSQVSTVNPQLSGRWTKERRFSITIDKLTELKPERFITHKFELRDASKAYNLID
ncbi:MAG: hypothetical protein AAFP70_19155, partial [Calditrichota bacterium]